METKRPEITNELGTIKIADEVVSTIAGLAAAGVEGVSAMSGGWGTDLVEKLGRKNFGKGIKVEVNEDKTSIDIFIVVEYGYPIPKVAENVQKEIRLAVETMTGLTVTAVNVHILAVSIKKEQKVEEEMTAEVDRD